MLTALMLIALMQTPSVGEIERELATDPDAFDAADTNGDGRVSALEFDAYRRARSGEAPASSFESLGGYDVNGDGALTPGELYVEADLTVGAAPAADPGVQDDGTYPVDDRDGQPIEPY